jgi:Mg2+/Co2+ transporter CorB
MISHHGYLVPELNLRRKGTMSGFYYNETQLHNLISLDKITKEDLIIHRTWMMLLLNFSERFEITCQTLLRNRFMPCDPAL